LRLSGVILRLTTPSREVNKNSELRGRSAPSTSSGPPRIPFEMIRDVITFEVSPKQAKSARMDPKRAADRRAASLIPDRQPKVALAGDLKRLAQSRTVFHHLTTGIGCAGPLSLEDQIAAVGEVAAISHDCRRGAGFETGIAEPREPAGSST
jgi:hypothetical protein